MMNAAKLGENEIKTAKTNNLDVKMKMTYIFIEEMMRTDNNQQFSIAHIQ